MYKTILVATDIEDGRRVLQELEERHLQITAAFWRPKNEEDWKLVIVSPEVDEKGTTSLYTMIALMLRELSIDPAKPLHFPLDRITLVSPQRHFYQRLKQRASPVREGPVRDATSTRWLRCPTQAQCFGTRGSSLKAGPEK